MLALEIVLIVAGLFFFTLSFFVTEKLSDSDIEYIKKLSEKEIDVLMKKELENASDKIQATIDEKTEDAIAKIESETDKDTDNKLLSIGEYGDTVIKNFNENSEKTLESVNKSHDQITFIYSMLSDKEKKIDKLSKELEYQEDYLRAFKTSIEEKADELKKLNIEVTAEDIKNAAPESRKHTEEANQTQNSSADSSDLSSDDGIYTDSTDADSSASNDADSNSAVAKYSASRKKTSKNKAAKNNASEKNGASKSNDSAKNSAAKNGDSDKNDNSTEVGISDLEDLKAAFEKEISNEKSENEKNPGEKSINETVLALYKQGYSEVEIAKNLGKGVGEVKLILGLFDEGKKA